MKVGDLIKLLREYPSDLRVVVDGYEDGYDDLTPKQIAVEKISLNTGENDWEGQHGFVIGEVPKDTRVVGALVLRRTSH